MFEDTVEEFFTMMKHLLIQPSHDSAESPSDSIPSATGVYGILDKKQNQIIYVGRSRNLRRRLLGPLKISYEDKIIIPIRQKDHGGYGSIKE